MTMLAPHAVGSPYRGLASFGDAELDALLFFGRERETELVTAHLIASRLTVLYGPSGVGKSSLLRAGVARRVRELGARRAVARGPDLACVVFSSWTDDPVAGLAAAIAGEVMPLVSPTAPPPPEGATLADVAEHWSEILDGDLCLVLDQVEEYFVYHEHDTGSDTLVEQLPELVTRQGLRANVLLSVRDDELARLGALKARIPFVFANARRLDRLDRDAARAAIVGPLRRWNELRADGTVVDIEPELVELVVAESATAETPDRVEAPYLQLVMERLWEEEASRGSHVLRAATLDELGGADVIVRAHLDRALAVLNASEQAAAARMFEHLVTPSGTKIAHRASDLTTFAHVDPAEGRRVLDTLGHERILRPLEDGEGAGGRYEIFHDVLADAILDWGRRRDLESERIATRRRQRRLLVLAGAALLAVAVMVGVTIYAVGQRGDARTQAGHARASALVAYSLASLPGDPELSLVLARDAAQLDPTRSTEDVLRTALLDSRARAVLRGHTGGVTAVGFWGSRVITVDRTGTLRVFPSRTAPALSAHRLGGRIRAVAVSAVGGVVVVARRRLVEVRNLASPGKSYAFRTSSPLRALAIDARGDRIAVATLDDRLLVRGAGVRTTLNTHLAAASLALDARGREVAVASVDGVSVWRLGRPKPVAVVHRADVTGVALAPDGSLLAAAGADGEAGLWRVPGGALTGLVVGIEPLTGVGFSADGSVVATMGRDGTTRTFTASDSGPMAVLAGHTDAVRALAFSADGRFVVTGSSDGTARIWDPGIAPELRLVAHPRGCCAALAAGPGGALVASGTRALVVRGGRVASELSQPARVTAVAWAGSARVTGGSDGRVRLTRADGSPRTFSAPGPVTAVAATPGEIVAGTRSGEVEAWALDGKKLLTFREHGGVAGLAISHDGRLLATAGDDGIARIRDLRTGRLLHELHGHTKPLTAVAFNPDDTLLATASFDHDVRTWDVASGRRAHLLRAHFAVVSGVAFSPDGRWLVSAGPITAGLWHADTGAFVLYLHGHTGRLVGAGFTPDGRNIVTAAVDGTIRSYRCEICGGVAELVRLADRRLAATGRTLTPAEKRRYGAP